MPHVTLPKTGTDKAWREAARACLQARIPPEQVSWSRGPAEDILFAEGEAPPAAKPGPIRVPPAFVELASQVCWHRDPERFARLYAFLWRVVAQPALMQDAEEPAYTSATNTEGIACLKPVHYGDYDITVTDTYAILRFQSVGDVPVRALRVTYVGELGWELYCPTEYGLALWRTLWREPHAGDG